jgi:DNA-binding transcriptional LysR family regulator
MNVHHLELFYYVARHGGIMEAVRNIPYGIQQPAVGGQIIQLEEFLGVTLFQRRPFSLTPQGKELYEFIKPFFENLTPMAEKLRGGMTQHLRMLRRKRCCAKWKWCRHMWQIITALA